MKKVKYPHPPRLLCNSTLEWILGIASPSKELHYNVLYHCGGGTQREREKMEQYYARCHAYNAYLWVKRVAARNVTKEEWKEHSHRERKEARMLRADEEMQKALKRLEEGIRKVGEEIALAIKEQIK